MQQKSPLGSTRASGVLDRVRWIEKTHGPDTTTQAPRARLRLPKQFAEAEPTPMMKPAESVQPRRVDEMPSPALSETSTACAKSPAAPPMRVPELISSPKPSHPAPKPSHSTPVVPVAPKMAKSATLGHMARPSLVQPQASSYDDDLLYKNGYSSSSDIDAVDPVHVGTRVDASEPVLYATKTLGGVRSRTRAARSRRFGKSQQATSNVSVHSNESEHEAPPTLRSSQSLTNIHAEYDEESPSSLLARLATRTANRPNVQDLVSNRSGPKFVKRSHHYNASPFKNESPAPSFANTWGRSERRFK
ncbi:hypothetical protein LPJ76_004255 [Coemansia sp. RSA 638]|nr:hypothetical protein LPJ76_004255 [Coemansia sp. RSA 638]